MNIVYIEHTQYIIIAKGFTLKAYLAQLAKIIDFLNYCRIPSIIPSFLKLTMKTDDRRMTTIRTN
jgi:hypothetical protein